MSFVLSNWLIITPMVRFICQNCHHYSSQRHWCTLNHPVFVTLCLHLTIRLTEIPYSQSNFTVSHKMLYSRRHLNTFAFGFINKRLYLKLYDHDLQICRNHAEATLTVCGLSFCYHYLVFSARSKRCPNTLSIAIGEWLKRKFIMSYCIIQSYVHTTADVTTGDESAN